MGKWPEDVRADRTRQWVKLLGFGKLPIKRWKSADAVKKRLIKDNYFKKNLIGELDQTEDWFGVSLTGLKNIGPDQKIYIKGDPNAYRTSHLFQKVTNWNLKNGVGCVCISYWKNFANDWKGYIKNPDVIAGHLVVGNFPCDGKDLFNDIFDINKIIRLFYTGLTMEPDELAQKVRRLPLINQHAANVWGKRYQYFGVGRDSRWMVFCIWSNGEKLQIIVSTTNRLKHSPKAISMLDELYGCVLEHAGGGL